MILHVFTSCNQKVIRAVKWSEFNFILNKTFEKSYTCVEIKSVVLIFLNLVLGISDQDMNLFEFL